MTTTLYHGEPNGPSLTVLAALFEKGAQAALERIDLAAGERHDARVPHAMEVEHSIEGEGPVLVVDGIPMADSVFLACYLDDVGSSPALRPAAPYDRWRMMTWCRYVIERVAPAASYLGVHANPPARVPDGATSIDLAQRWSDAVAGRFDESRLADSRAKITQAVERIEQELGHGGDWLIGDFSIADLESYAWLAGMPALVPDAFADRPRTTAWLARVKARPAVARALATATTAAPELVWAPGPEINRWG
jgi:GST-like protein